MKNISTLPLCQGGKNHDKINNCISHGTIELISHDNCESTMPSLEEISVAKAKEYLKKMLLPQKEATQVFSNLEQARISVEIFNNRKSREQLPANITETPKFNEAKTESLELSDSDWDTSEYDPVALEQAIEEAEYNAYTADQELRSYFSLTRGVEV